MATTSLVGVMEREWGFWGRAILIGSLSGFLRSWKWSVQSHDAEISRAMRVVSFVFIDRESRLTMLFTVHHRLHWCTMCTQNYLFTCFKVYPVLEISIRLICSQSSFPYLFTCQSIPALKASLSSAPKHTSSTGARCSYFSISFPPASSPCVSYR